MTKLELAEKMCGLFTDGAVGKASKVMAMSREETFGAMMFSTAQFKKAYALLNEVRREG